MGGRATFVACVLVIVGTVAPVARVDASDVYRRWVSPKTATCATTATGVRVAINNTDVEFNDLPQGAQFLSQSVTNGVTNTSGPFPVEQLTGTKASAGVAQAFLSYPFTLLLRIDTIVGSQIVYRSTLDLSCAADGVRSVTAVNEEVPPMTPYRRWASPMTMTCTTTAAGVEVATSAQVVEFNNLPQGAQYTSNVVRNGVTTTSGPYPVERFYGTITYGHLTTTLPSYPFTYLFRIDTIVGGQVVYRSTLDLSCAADGSRNVAAVNEDSPLPAGAPYRRWVSPKTATCATTASGVRVMTNNQNVEFNNLPQGAQYTSHHVSNGVTTTSGPFPVERLDGTMAYLGVLVEFASYPFTFLYRIDTIVGGQVVYRSTLDLSCAANGVRSLTAINEDVSTGPPSNSDLVTVQPERLFDSRSSGGARPAGSVTQVQVTGRGGVPVGASAAALNVTAVQAGDAGFMTVFPCGTSVPEASNLNYRNAQTIPNAAVVKLDAAGRVCVFTSATSGLLVDVNGYTPAASDVVALDPFRLYDSRSGAGSRPAGSVTEVQVAGAGGVPGDASAALLNVTAVVVEGDGFMTVFPCGTAVPVASNLNYRVGQTIANAVLARLGAGGKVCVYTDAGAHLIVDVNGAVPATSDIAAVDPYRLYDTRNGAGPAGAGTTTAVQVAGAGGVPAGAVTAVLNVTALEAGDAGFVTVYPCDAALPVASNLNFAAGDTIPNAVIAKLSSAGSVCLFTSSAAGLIVDVNGYAT